MVRLQGVPPRGVVLGFKGIIDFYSWKGIPVARRWPRKPNQPRTPEVQAQWPDFKAITQGFKTIDVTVVDALYGQSGGTLFTTKDLAVSLFYGNSVSESNGPFP
jgi:hypothetical protein